MVIADTHKNQHRQLRILVAEDNAINQRLVQKILQWAAYAVDIVDNGRETAELAGRNRYDCILMDIQLTGYKK